MPGPRNDPEDLIVHIKQYTYLVLWAKTEFLFRPLFLIWLQKWDQNEVNVLQTVSYTVLLPFLKNHFFVKEETNCPRIKVLFAVETVGH